MFAPQFQEINWNLKGILPLTISHWLWIYYVLCVHWSMFCFLYSVTSSADLIIAEIWNKGMFESQILFTVFTNNYYTAPTALLQLKQILCFTTQHPFVNIKTLQKWFIAFSRPPWGRAGSLKHFVYWQLMGWEGIHLV